jgi:hypothetical protein
VEAAWRNVEVSGEGGKAETCQLEGEVLDRLLYLYLLYFG